MGVTTQPKTGRGTHAEVWGGGLGGGHFALYLSHYFSPEADES